MTITGILEGKRMLGAGQTAMQLQTLPQPQSPRHTLRITARGWWMVRLLLSIPRLICSQTLLQRAHHNFGLLGFLTL